MNWSTPSDLRAQVERLWRRGELFHTPGEMLDASRWPVRLVLKGPSSADMTGHFDAVREWAMKLAAMPHLRLEWREVRHRVHGRQRLPAAVWIDEPDAALALIGKRREVARWQGLWERASAEFPALLPWLVRRPLQALELAACWPRLLAVVRWMLAHPRPGVYLRQVDAPGVDSKFIETHRAVLSELLDLALPAEAIDAEATGTGGFARRYGFREKPVLIRFRSLDPALAIVRCGSACPDTALDAESFATLDLPLRRVFITENEINYLAFPPIRESIVIFGKGYGWESLSRAGWLSRLPVHYWGDIDTHGFAILDQLRERFPHVRSFLMNRETLLAHQDHWDRDPRPASYDPRHLTDDERALFDDLRDDRLGERLRLEQERIGFPWLMKALAEIG